MSIHQAVKFLNVLPKMDLGMSPDELFSKTTSNNEHLLRLMPWGCPGYVSMATLQDGKKIPKWKSQARKVQYMGWSPLHASTVGLVRNLYTGCMSA